jgi:hypothetical protein
VKIEVCLDEHGNIQLVRKAVDHKKFVQVMNEIAPEYENTMAIAALIKHAEWESDRLFEYLEKVTKQL